MSQDFILFAQAHGLIIGSLVEGRWARTKTEDKPTHRNGAYKFLGDVGFVQNHATMQEVAIWRPGGNATPIDLARQRAEIEAARRREAQKQIAAMRRMRSHWASLPPLLGEHPYLVRKQLTMLGCKGLRLDGNSLTIPVCREADLISLQTITPDGEKKYRYGCPIRGGSYVLRRPGAAVTCLAEGFATGLAIYQALPQASVIVCFDAGNMVAVARRIKVRGMAVVCADNDWKSAGRTGVNTGVEKGKAAAEAIGCGFVYPEGIFGSDWADALAEWKEDGPGRLRVEIMRGAKPVF